MADQHAPNPASRKSQAEGDRQSRDMDTVDAARSAEEQAGGITNRPLDEEVENQEAIPARGESKPGAHAGHGEQHRKP